MNGKCKYLLVPGLLCLILFLMPGRAQALSCAPPVLDEEVIDNAQVIFEGIPSNERELNMGEKLSAALLTGRMGGGGMSNLRVYKFAVIRAWKGVTAGDTVEVLYNTYWGDGFGGERTYLVISEKNVGGLYWAPLCGHTREMAAAEESGDLALLDETIGRGLDLKVPASDRVCEKDSDCIAIQTDCADCGCGTPVNAKHAARYEARLTAHCAALEADQEPAEPAECPIPCDPYVPQCEEGMCR